MGETGLTRRFVVGRRRAIACGVAVGLAVLHGAVWWVVSGRLVAAWPGAVAQAAHDGWTIRGGQAVRGGWPFTATARVPGLVAERSLGRGGLRWTSESLELTVALGDPRRLAIRPRGGQSIQLGDQPAVAIEFGSAELYAPLAGDAPMELHVQAFAAPGLHVGRLEARFDATVATVMAEGAQLSPPLSAPFDGGADLALRALLNVPFPVAASPAQSALAWQKMGGRVSVPEFMLRWGPASASGHGAGGLDARLQPTFAADIRVTGAAEVLDGAARAGTIQPGAATAAKAVLQLLAMAAPGQPVAVPVTLQDGTLAVANFALLRAPVLDWNAP